MPANEPGAEPSWSSNHSPRTLIVKTSWPGILYLAYAGVREGQLREEEAVAEERVGVRADQLIAEQRVELTNLHTHAVADRDGQADERLVQVILNLGPAGEADLIRGVGGEAVRVNERR